MNIRLHRAGMALLVPPLMAGCASWRASFNELMSKEGSEQYESVDRHSSYPVIRRENFEQVNLLEMIDPERKSGVTQLKGWGKEGDPINYGRQYDVTLSWFRTTAELPDARKAVIRDGVQDKILAVSTSRCNVFKTFLRRQQTDVNFTLGSLTTLAGVLGAVLPGARDSRNLAGAAGLFSGLQAEYNQAYFSNLAAHVIVQAIELRQNRLKQELMDGRKAKGIQDYSMEAAINDAIVIDGNCSALAGLIEAQDSIKEVETPGFRMAARAMTSARALQELNAKPVSELQTSGGLDRLMAIAGGTVPSLLVTSVKPGVNGPLTVELASSANVAAAVMQQVEQRGIRVAATYDALQKALPDNQRSKLASGEVAKAFSASVGGKLMLQDGDSEKLFKTCSSKAESAAADLSALMTRLAVSKGDAQETAKIAYDRDVAEAKVRMVLAQIGAVKNQAQAQAENAASKAVAKLQTANLGVEFADAAKAATAMKDLPVEKITASCS